MEAYPLLVDFLTLLGISIPVSFLFYRLRLPLIAGFLATGVIVGPYGTGLISAIETVRVLAEIGVVLLLFTIGLEFSLRQLLSSNKKIFLIAAAQIVATSAVTALLSRILGLQITQGIFLGFLFSLSSTAIVLKILSDRAEVDTPHGKIMIGILLFQDLCVIPMMLISPGLAGGAIDVLHIVKQLLLAIITVIVLFLTARYVVPLLLSQVVQIRNRDLFLFTILFTCLGTAYVSASMGLSLAIGAFIAGLVISESSYSHQILSDILPFRDVFNAIFFISIGMLLNFPLFLQELELNLAVTAAIFLGKMILVLVILILSKTIFRISFITAFSLAQVGEFSFLLAEEGMHYYILPESLYQLFLASSVLTMFLTPFAMLVARPIGLWIQHRLGDQEVEEPEAVDAEKKDHLIIIGFGLNGKNLARVVKDIGIPFLVIELNDQLVREAREQEIPAVFGDATRKEVLLKTGAGRAKMAVVAISDASATRHCVAVLRNLNPSMVILVRTRYVMEVESLMKLGANLVMPEEFETSIEIFSRVLEQYNVPDHLIQQQVSVVRSDSYSMLRGLSLTQERLLKISELFLKSTVQQVVVSAYSPAKNRTVRSLDLRKETGASIIAVLRDDQAITNPDADFMLKENDVLVLWGAHGQLAAAAARLVKIETTG